MLVRTLTVMAALACLGGCRKRGPLPAEGYIQVPGGPVWYRIAGSGSGTPLICLHGGPGGDSDEFRPLERLGDDRPIVRYDQLGGGRSGRPKNKSLWTTGRFVRELQAVRDALKLDEVVILGHSWGTMLAMDYMLTHPHGVKALILAGPGISVPRYLADAEKLRAQLPKETQAILAKHEADGTTDSKEYQDATMVFYKRHLCRREPWPTELTHAFENFGTDVYLTMWGPTEFYATGLLKNYDRTSQLGELKLPVLFTCGRYDEVTPEQTAYYHSLVPGSRFVVFENSAHMTILEEPDRYVAVAREFLREVDRGGR